MKQLKCKYQEWCWRLVYSYVCQDQKYELKDAPDRFTLLCNGYLDNFDNIFPTGGVYCRNLPYHRGTKIENLCPELEGLDYTTKCEEYIHECKVMAYRGDTSPRFSQTVKRVRGFIPPKIRKAVYRKYKFSCAYCGININQKKAGLKTKMHIDHKVPLAQGGTDEYSNLVLACSSCNQAKKDSIWEEGCRK